MSKDENMITFFFTPTDGSWNGGYWATVGSGSKNNKLGKKLNIIKAMKKTCPQIDTNFEAKKFNGESIKVTVKFITHKD